MWPKLSNIDGNIAKKIKSYSKPDVASTLSPWIRVFSGATVGQSQGLILQSNTSAKLLRATGESISTIYGDAQSSGTVGTDWEGNPVESDPKRFLRPSPIITGFSVKEGQDQISRDATLQLTAYTLEQMEAIQTYFLEPGYSLFIEWGWNTNEGVGGLTTTGKGVDNILNEIAKKSLNWGDLVKTRLNTDGEYDAFLGFIVGGSVSSNGENFNIEVRLKGEPSLPTYLQSYRNSKKINEETVIETDKVNDLFSTEELTDEKGSIAKRRFRYMFNELPGDKQLKKIAKLEDVVNDKQFINFDKLVEKKIAGYNRTFFGGDKEFTVEGAEVKQESLFSKNKYIRMDLAVEILNTLGELDTFQVGDKQVSFKINIDNTVIGAFPNMFSTNANKLIIPGVIPDFSKYFLEGNSVIQEKNGNLEISGTKAPPVLSDSNLIPFVESKPLTMGANGYQETDKYWGYLKHLFVNFDVFKNVLDKKIINSREAFISILNEMSSAVNAFWKFQVVEGEFKQKLGFIEGIDDIETYRPPVSNGKKQGDIELTVIDENFIGELPDELGKNITRFKHNGIGSVFLNADLDISLPSSMVGQIVSSRLGAAVNPDASILKVGEKSFFKSETDLFVKVRPEVGNSEPSGSNSAPTDEKTSKQLEEDFNNNYKIINVGAGGRAIYDKNNNKIGTAIIQSDGTLAPKKREENNQALANAVNKSNSIQAAKKTESERKSSNLQGYLEKLDVVPLIEKNTFDETTLSENQLLDDDWFKKSFAIHCFDDSDFFDLLKNNFMRGKPTGLSTLIPIKYTFTILGNSGIRRGDVFRIDGIPSRYSENGIFQITEIEHNLEGSKWTTQIGGLFRQIQ
jgi:hypothetical protein